MKDSSKPTDEKIIKNRKRVQNHGEVFTPNRIVKKMLDLPATREACQSLTTTFLEPAAGEGVFLVEVLKRKLTMVAQNYGDDLIRYENYSLMALSTLYGIELLGDNTQKCAMNMYQVYFERYQQLASEHGAKLKNKVLNSAKLIISKNIVQGNFLTRLAPSGKPLIFCEWQVINFRKGIKNLKVQRTEYTLKDVIGGIAREDGETSIHSDKVDQLDLFNLFGDEEALETEQKQMKYVPGKITDVYKEEMEEVDG